MMPEGAAGKPQRTLEEVLADDESRAAGNLAVRNAKKEGKDLAGLTSPPDSGPPPRGSKAGNLPRERPAIGPSQDAHPRDSKVGNLPRERPAIGQSQAASSGNVGSQFQDM